MLPFEGLLCKVREERNLKGISCVLSETVALAKLLLQGADVADDLSDKRSSTLSNR